MKAAAISVLFIVILVLMSWSRGNCDHKLPMVLPLLHGGEVGIYDAASAIMVVIGIAGLVRLASNQRNDDDRN
jgi:hypothetical protein